MIDVDRRLEENEPRMSADIVGCESAVMCQSQFICHTVSGGHSLPDLSNKAPSPASLVLPGTRQELQQ